jgi:hypothetical protein
MSQLKLGRPRMTPQEFSAKWPDAQLKERAGSQEHFIEVCALVGSPAPANVDKTGAFFTFERGVVQVVPQGDDRIVPSAFDNTRPLSRSGGEALRDPLLLFAASSTAHNTLGVSWRKVCAAISYKKPRLRRCGSL